MDSTHLHLVLTHFPIVGTIIGIGVLIYGQFSKNNDVKKVALAIFILMSLITIPAFLTGEEAEETVENLAGVSEQLIDNHEYFASIAMWLMSFLGVLAIVNIVMIIQKLSFAKTLSWITLAVSLVTFGLFAKVGSLGGEIRHSEIRTNKVTNTNVPLNNEKEEDDDD